MSILDPKYGVLLDKCFETEMADGEPFDGLMNVAGGLLGAMRLNGWSGEMGVTMSKSKSVIDTDSRSVEGVRVPYTKWCRPAAAGHRSSRGLIKTFASIVGLSYISICGELTKY